MRKIVLENDGGGWLIGINLYGFSITDPERYIHQRAAYLYYLIRHHLDEKIEAQQRKKLENYFKKVLKKWDQEETIKHETSLRQSFARC